MGRAYLVRVKSLRLMEFFYEHSMDPSLMNECHISEKYENGVSEFLQYVQEHAISSNGTYFFSCVLCLNQIRQDLGIMRDHLFIFGIMRSYTLWTWHGEVLDKPMTS